MGGGEQMAGANATCLAEDFDVELIGVEDFDRQRFASILGKPKLANIPLRIIGSGHSDAAAASADYDLFINHSFTSEDMCLAPLGIYVVFFPQVYRDPDESMIQRGSILTSHHLADRSIDKISLSDGEGFEVTCEKAERITLAIKQQNAGLVLIDGNRSRIIGSSTSQKIEVAYLDLPEGTSKFRVVGEKVQMLSPQFDSGARIPIVPKRPRGESTPAFVDTYNLILAISEYTQSWISHRWNAQSVVHNPPVKLRQQTFEKERIILSVGRFFAEDKGHCKQQLRLVRAFKKMVDHGLEDWRLVLIGGCDKENREYALSVRQEASGFPIDVLLNCDLDTLNSHIGKASIYWHATGFGQDLRSHPERAEHFGIAPVEAMSAGAIPVVYALGGPAEIVQEGENGFIFSSESELVDRTFAITRFSDEVLANFRSAASTSSHRFSEEKFDIDLKSHVHRLLKS
jgi:glycosyltransferase involved in cell wall biosynthesis